MTKPICRVGKIKASGATTPQSVDGHLNRTRECAHVDPEKTSLNRHLVGGGVPLAESIDAVLEARGLDRRALRKDAVLANDILLTLSPEYFSARADSPRIGGRWDQERTVAFAKTAKTFLKEQFGDLLVEAVLHLDERTPHIHAVVVPVLPHQTDRHKSRLSSKDMFNPQGLRRLQDDYQRAVKPLGIGPRLKGSTAKHTEVKEFYSRVQDKVTKRENLLKETQVQTPPEKGRLQSDASYQAEVAEYMQEVRRDLRKQVNKAAGLNLQTELLQDKENRGDFVVDKYNKLYEKFEALKSEHHYTKEEVQRLRKTNLNDVAARLEFYGEIGRKENAIDLVMRVGEVDAGRAVAWLGQEFGESAAIQAIQDYNYSTDVEAVRETLREQGDTPIFVKSDYVRKDIVDRQLSSIGADEYRLTFMRENGKGAENIGKMYLKKELLSKNEILSIIPQIGKINASGGNIFITPQPKNDIHYLLLDDVKNSNLELLDGAGFTPCITQETSPHNFQALFKVKTMKEVAATVFTQLNLTFGDKKIMGVIHPFRLAGFTNQKEKHRDEKGHFPFVTLHKSVNRLCEKTMELVEKQLNNFRRAEEKYRLPNQDRGRWELPEETTRGFKR